MISIQTLFESISKSTKIEKLSDPNQIIEFVKPYLTNPKVYTKGHDVWVANHRGQYVGGVVFDLHPNIDQYLSLNLRPKVEIVFVYLHPEHRRKGLGKRMISKVVDNYDKICLFTTKGQTSDTAIRIYKGLGFNPVKDLPTKTLWYKK